MTETWYTIEKDNLVVNLLKSEYDYIERIAKNEFKDSRSQMGLIKTYAIIKHFANLNPLMQYVPIHINLFRDGISVRNYSLYHSILEKHGVISIKKERKETYTDVAGKRHVVCSSPKRYRILLQPHQYSKGIFFLIDTRKIPIRIKLPSDEIISLRIKTQAIMNGIVDGIQTEKIDNLMSISDEESYVVSLVIKLIKDVYNEKVKSQFQFDKRIHAIAKLYKADCSLKTKEYILSILVYKVLISLYKIKKKDEVIKRIEHIVCNNLSNKIDNQIFRWSEKRLNTNGKLSYYKELSVDYEALNYCIRLTDLYHIARVAEIPKYQYPSHKLYSKLASMRRSIRQFVRYKDDRLVEVSDIHSAHFTMLPLIFDRCHISIPEAEMRDFKQLTQAGDLYQDVAKNTAFSRNELKPVFQPFFSIKSEKSFLYNRDELDRQKRQLICDYFNKNFPFIYAALINFHCNQVQTIKSVANGVESDIMNPICDTLRKRGLHPFRIHDAIYLPISERDILDIDIKQVVFNTINSPASINKPRIIC
jgi:hypothetical protein